MNQHIDRVRHGIWLALFAVTGVLWAAAPIVNAAGAISQGFTTSDDVATGSIMQLKVGAQNVTELATADNADRLLGVIGNKSLVELGGGSKQVQVVTNGLTAAIVSDINGAINTGDKITASPIKGIGMKATQSTTVVGTAQGSLSSVSTANQTITDRKGKSHTIHIGTIPVQVNVAYYGAKDDQLSPLIPSFLQTVSNSVVGHNVSALRVVIGALALMMGFLTVSIMLFSAVRSGLIAIGRNPMAQGALRKGLLEVIITAVGILVLTVMLIYVILAT